MTDNPRALKLADRIKVIVATMLDTRVKDPRLGFVTITDVRVSGDLQHATVFYTVFGTDEEREGTAAALHSATGMLRRRSAGAPPAPSAGPPDPSAPERPSPRLHLSAARPMHAATVPPANPNPGAPRRSEEQHV